MIEAAAPGKDLTRDTTLHDLGFDDFAVVNLAMDLEDYFSVRLTDSDEDKFEDLTLGQIEDLILRKAKAR